MIPMIHGCSWLVQFGGKYSSWIDLSFVAMCWSCALQSSTIRSTFLPSLENFLSRFSTHSINVADIIHAFLLDFYSTRRCLEFLQQQGLADLPIASRGSLSEASMFAVVISVIFSLLLLPPCNNCLCKYRSYQEAA